MSQSLSLISFSTRENFSPAKCIALGWRYLRGVPTINLEAMSLKARYFLHPFPRRPRDLDFPNADSVELGDAGVTGLKIRRVHASKSSIFTGNSRTRTPVAWCTASVIAAAIPARPISPIPRAPSSLISLSG